MFGPNTIDTGTVDKRERERREKMKEKEKEKEKQTTQQVESQ